MSNKWFRMYSEFATNYKVQMLSEINQRRFVMLMILQLINNNKHIEDDVVSFQLRISDIQAQETKKILFDAGLINADWSLTKELETTECRPCSFEWRLIRARIFKRDNYTCQYCGKYGNKLECDHVIPVSKGGLHGDDNLVTSCFKCNRSKRSKLLSEWGRL